MVFGFDRAKWLSGTCVLKTNPTVREIVKNGYWTKDGKKVPIRSRGRNSLGQRLVSMNLDGDAISATLNDDDELVWETGEVWELDMLEAAYTEAVRQAELAREMHMTPEEQSDRAASVALEETKHLGFNNKTQRQQAAKMAVKWTASCCSEDAPVEMVKKVGNARRKHGRKGTCVPLEAKVVSIFEKFDSKGLGKINAEQLKRALQTIDAHTFTAEVCQRLFETLDSSCNGEVEFAELCDWMYSRKDLSMELLKASDKRDSDLARIRRFDGRYVHKSDGDVSEIIEKGRVHLGDSVWVPIKLNGSDGFTIGVDDMELGARIVDEELVWDDGDVWILQGEKEIHEAIELARRRSRDAGRTYKTQDKAAIKEAVEAAVTLSQSAGDGRYAFAKNVARARRLSGTATNCIANPDKVVELFEKFDRDGNGEISFVELLSTLKQVNPEIFTSQTCTRLFASADANDNGKVDFTELIQWIYADIDGVLPLAVLSATSKHYSA
eukprot:TRINITY_DN3629_c0_g1_i1.p1 TRINITY_DN3629_c0_g1~~TRINITY_DN3629_c0_g1_i1.p1  ORF type:complete len:496 (-),score=109.91 TRINITY_DN3629_c0_g1_i1:173-1660(-)